MSRLSGIPFEGTVNFPDMATATEFIREVTVPGAKIGDAIIFGNKSGTWNGLAVFAEVNDADTIRFIGMNLTGSNVDATTKTVHGLVIPGDLLKP